jgi:hypothetical protein
MMKRHWIAAVAVTLVATVAVSCANPLVTPSDSPSGTPDPAEDILARIGSARLESLSSTGTVVNIVGYASGVGADATRTLWYENVAAAAYAQVASVDQANRQVVDASGTVLDAEVDPVAADVQDAFAPLSMSSDDIANAVAPGAKELAVQVVSIEYIELYGGIGEIVIEPGDVIAFIASAGANIPILMKQLVQDQRPYLVTVVNADQEPQLVIGYTPGVGAAGQGLGWVAPDVKTDAIVGSAVVE